MSDIILRLPFPPSINSYLSSYGNKRFMSKKSKLYQNNAIQLIKHQFKGKTIFEHINVSIEYTRPDKRRRDVDNYHKCLLDAVKKAGLWGDDSQIQKLTLEWGSETEPCAIVRIIR